MRPPRRPVTGGIVAILALLTLPAVVPAPAAGQATPVDTRQGATECPYRLCGLRVYGSSIVRGFGGWQRVGRLGPLGGDIGILVQGPDSAAVNALRYQGLQRRATAAWLASLPLLLLGGSAAVSDPGQYTNHQLPVFAAAWTTGLYALNRAVVSRMGADHALDRALWAYNERYVPDVVPPPALHPVEPARDASAWLIFGGGGAGALVGGLGGGEEWMYGGSLVGAGAGALLSALLVRW